MTCFNITTAIITHLEYLTFGFRMAGTDGWDEEYDHYSWHIFAASWWKSVVLRILLTIQSGLEGSEVLVYAVKSLFMSAFCGAEEDAKYILKSHVRVPDKYLELEEGMRYALYVYLLHVGELFNLHWVGRRHLIMSECVQISPPDFQTTAKYIILGAAGKTLQPQLILWRT